MPTIDDQGPIRIRELLDRRSAPLAELLRRAAELRRLQRALERELPGPLRDHITVASFDQKTLVLQTDGPAWASRLRFETPRLIEVARRKCDLPSVQTVRILVAPPAQNRPPRRRDIRLSRPAADALRSSASSTDDAALRESLLRLSRHA